MAEHLIRFHTEYETIRSNDKTIQNIFNLLKYLMSELKNLEDKLNADKPKTE